MHTLASSKFVLPNVYRRPTYTTAQSFNPTRPRTFTHLRYWDSLLYDDERNANDGCIWDEFPQLCCFLARRLAEGLLPVCLYSTGEDEITDRMSRIAFSKQLLGGNCKWRKLFRSRILNYLLKIYETLEISFSIISLDGIIT